MQYRNLGASGLKVPALSFGAARSAAKDRCSPPGATAAWKKRGG
jgi:aryl-alcohol dehydrogenase-like predicted oxidoreductase